ncbi:MAG TPA: Sec-independent protein translocase protein TatB [Acidimicrobiales bacterium]|nr:Sec-independent protein translocase protein TatB [Acidimicrobiales bacterium]
MFNVGGGELLVILLVALIVLGPQRLPGAARQIGKVAGDLRRMSDGFQRELRDAFDVAEAPSRPAEPVPMARAVTAADRHLGPRPAPGGEPPAPVRRDLPAAASDGGPAGVAPAVADALEEIIGRPTRPAAPERSPGDERAAS